MNFVTIYFQLYHFTIWPQRNAPYIILLEKFFPWKFPTNFFRPSKKIIKNKCNHISCKTSLAQTSHTATKLLKFIVCSFWFVKCLSYQYINVYFFSTELLLILKFLLWQRPLKIEIIALEKCWTTCGKITATRISKSCAQ